MPEFFFFLLLAAKIERRSRDRVTTYRRQSFHRSYRNTAHEIRHSSIWQHFAPFLHFIAPRAVMSNYENKQIPQKTGLATYSISKSHGTAVTRGCFSRSLPAPIAASPLNFAANNRKKNPFAHRIPRPRITRKIKWSIGHLHNGVILLLWPEFLSFFLSHLNLQWILARFK